MRASRVEDSPAEDGVWARMMGFSAFVEIEILDPVEGSRDILVIRVAEDPCPMDVAPVEVELAELKIIEGCTHVAGQDDD